MYKIKLTTMPMYMDWTTIGKLAFTEIDLKINTDLKYS